MKRVIKASIENEWEQLKEILMEAVEEAEAARQPLNYTIYDSKWGDVYRDCLDNVCDKLNVTFEPDHNVYFIDNNTGKPKAVFDGYDWDDYVVDLFMESESKSDYINELDKLVSSKF